MHILQEHSTHTYTEGTCSTYENNYSTRRREENGAWRELNREKGVGEEPLSSQCGRVTPRHPVSLSVSLCCLLSTTPRCDYTSHVPTARSQSTWRWVPCICLIHCCILSSWYCVQGIFVEGMNECAILHWGNSC